MTRNGVHISKRVSKSRVSHLDVSAIEDCVGSSQVEDAQQIDAVLEEVIDGRKDWWRGATWGSNEFFSFSCLLLSFEREAIIPSSFSMHGVLLHRFLLSWTDAWASDSNGVTL